MKTECEQWKVGKTRENMRRKVTFLNITKHKLKQWIEPIGQHFGLRSVQPIIFEWNFYSSSKTNLAKHFILGISSADMGHTGERYTLYCWPSCCSFSYHSTNLSGNNTTPKRYPKTGFNFLKFELPLPPLFFPFVSSSALLPIQLQSGYLLSSRSQLYNAPNTTGRSGWVEWISSRGAAILRRHSFISGGGTALCSRGGEFTALLIQVPEVPKSLGTAHLC